jgi:molybdopterin molybdotransferase
MAMAADGSQGSSQGSGNRTRVADAIAWIDARLAALGGEEVRLEDAAGRVLIEDVQAPLDLPPFDRAAVDGFAVRADETVGASTYNPLRFRLARHAGDVDEAVELPAGGAARLEAGDRLPRGADAIVPIDHVETDEAGACTIIDPVVAGNEVERAGSHGARGLTLVRALRRLGPGDIGMLAAAGLARASVVMRPQVHCLLSVDASEAGTLRAPGATSDANAAMLRALIERDGGIVEQRGIALSGAGLREALASPGADIVLVVGSAGRGFDDRLAAALAEAGALAINGVALRPGATAGVGLTPAGVPLFLLPATPVACYWAYEFFAGRGVRRLGGRDPAFPFRSREMTAARKIVSEIGMTEVCPVRCAGEGAVEPAASFADAGLRAITEADGFLVIPEGREGYQKGAVLTVYLYDEQGRAQS